VGHLLPKQGLNRLTATAQRGGFEPPTPESYRRDGFRSRRISPPCHLSVVRIGSVFWLTIGFARYLIALRTIQRIRDALPACVRPLLAH
jgi:hypothetical protein